MPGRVGYAPRFEPGESQEQLPCKRDTSAWLGMCHRIRFVFASYSLRILLVFCPLFPMGVRRRFEQVLTLVCLFNL